MVVLGQAKTNTLKSDAFAPKPAMIRRYKRQRITARRSDRVITLYVKGFSTREIAKQTEISRSTVLRILKDAAIAMRPRGGSHQ
jgi:DNA invertase Pin-like site-specific DNA recombinase